MTSYDPAIMSAHGGERYDAPASAPAAERVLYARGEAWRFPTVDAMIAAMRANAKQGWA